MHLLFIVETFAVSGAVQDDKALTAALDNARAQGGKIELRKWQQKNLYRCPKILDHFRRSNASSLPDSL